MTRRNYGNLKLASDVSNLIRELGPGNSKELAPPLMAWHKSLDLSGADPILQMETLLGVG